MSARSQAATAAHATFGYHRDQHLGWRRAAVIIAAIALLEAAALAGYILLHSTVYITIAATPDGRVIEATPLEEPIMSDAALRNWTVTAVTEAFTLGHHDWRMRLADVRTHFTDDGYAGYVEALEKSLFLDRLTENLQVASAVATGAPVITATYIFDGQAAWAVEFPLLVTFHAGARTLNQKMTAEVLVMRVPLSDRPAGIGVQQLIVTGQS